MNPANETSIVRLKVDGMVCGSCSAAVSNMLLATDGVTHAAVSHATHTAEVHYRRAVLTPAQIAEIIDDCGFDAEVMEEARAHSVCLLVQDVGLDLEGPQRHLEHLDGLVGQVKVDRAADTVTVYYDPAVTGPRAILRALQEAGYEPSLANVADAATLALDANAVKAAELWQARLALPLVSRRTARRIVWHDRTSL